MSKWHVFPVCGSKDTFTIGDEGDDMHDPSIVRGCDEYGCGVQDKYFADQIVREHNCHEDLLETCEALLALLEAFRSSGMTMTPRMLQDIISDIGGSIAKAKGTP